MTRVLLIRHGETAWNLERRWQGHVDVPLSPAGERQANALAERLHARHPGLAIYSSDLARARETAERMACVLGGRVIVEPAWREMDVGRWAGHTWSEIRERFPEDLRRIAEGEDVPRGGGETWAAFTRRTADALEALRRAHPRQTVAVVSHSGVIRAVGLSVLGLPFARLRETPVPDNAGFLVLETTDGGWCIRTAGEGLPDDDRLRAV